MFDPDACRELEIARLTALYALPSPEPVALADIQTNAVLIDLAGHVRQVNLPTLLPVVRVPVWEPVDVRFHRTRAPRPCVGAVEFLLSSIQDGIAVYRQAR